MSWKAEYAILIMISTLIDYFSARMIHKYKDIISIKKCFLWLSLITNLGLLFSFKYFNFVSASVREFLSLFSISFDSPVLYVLLPVGISFYTFQTMGYTIDVYRGKIKPEKHLGIFAVYVSFFPQLVAGPIERAGNLLPQFLKKNNFEYKRVTDGLKVMLWGFFLKIVIADRLAMTVNVVYNGIGDYTGIPLILATYFFAFQVYCDFAGYSFIAIGAAKIMGINLMDNFRRPYHSKSLSEFWNRWHISLSTWFKDYVYQPLLGKSISMSKLYFSLFMVFLLSGIWHGANWTFAIWGALHGGFLVVSTATYNFRMKMAKMIGITRFPRTHGLIKMAIVFNLVCFGFIFFRANSLGDAYYIVTHLFSNWSMDFLKTSIGGIRWTDLTIAIGFILFMEFVHLLQAHIKVREFLDDKPVWIRWCVYIAIILFILIFGVFEETPFIYFQF